MSAFVLSRLDYCNSLAVFSSAVISRSASAHLKLLNTNLTIAGYCILKIQLLPSTKAGWVGLGRGSRKVNPWTTLHCMTLMHSTNGSRMYCVCGLYIATEAYVITSVCRSVCHDREPCKTAEPWRCRLGCGLGGHKEPCIRPRLRSCRSQMRRVNFEGKGADHCKVLAVQNG